MRRAKVYSLLFPPPPSPPLQKKISLESGSQSCAIAAVGLFSHLSLPFFFPLSLKGRSRDFPSDAPRSTKAHTRQRRCRPAPPVTFLLLHGGTEGDAPQQQQQHQDSGPAGPGGGQGAADAHGVRGTWREHGAPRRAAPRSALPCAPLRPAQLLAAALPLRNMLEGGRRGLRAHVPAQLQADCCCLLLPLSPPPPPLFSSFLCSFCRRGCGAAGAGRGTTVPSSALRPAAERRGSLWGRRGGGWGGSKERGEEEPAAPSPPR